jgi:hypothetical protein
MNGAVARGTWNELKGRFATKEILRIEEEPS